MYRSSVPWEKSRPCAYAIIVPRPACEQIYKHNIILFYVYERRRLHLRARLVRFTGPVTTHTRGSVRLLLLLLLYSLVYFLVFLPPICTYLRIYVCYNIIVRTRLSAERDNNNYSFIFENIIILRENIVPGRPRETLNNTQL